MGFAEIRIAIGGRGFEELDAELPKESTQQLTDRETVFRQIA